MRTALRRWGCVLAVGGAVLAGRSGARAAAVYVSMHGGVGASDASRLMFDVPPAASDGVIERCVGDSDARWTDNPPAEVTNDAVPVASFLSVTNEQIAVGAAVSFPTSIVRARARARARAAPVAPLREFSDSDEGSGSPRIPPATLIPLPPGVWTAAAGLGWLGLMSLGRRGVKMA